MVPLGMGCCDHHVGMGRMECRETGGTGIGMLGLEGGCPWTSIFEPGLGKNTWLPMAQNKDEYDGRKNGTSSAAGSSASQLVVI